MTLEDGRTDVSGDIVNLCGTSVCPIVTNNRVECHLVDCQACSRRSIVLALDEKLPSSALLQATMVAHVP